MPVYPSICASVIFIIYFLLDVCLSVYLSSYLSNQLSRKEWEKQLGGIQIMNMMVKNLERGYLGLMVWNGAYTIFLVLKTWFVRLYKSIEHNILSLPQPTLHTSNGFWLWHICTKVFSTNSLNWSLSPPPPQAGKDPSWSIHGSIILAMENAPPSGFCMGGVRTRKQVRTDIELDNVKARAESRLFTPGLLFPGVTWPCLQTFSFVTTGESYWYLRGRDWGCC